MFLQLYSPLDLLVTITQTAANLAILTSWVCQAQWLCVCVCMFACRYYGWVWEPCQPGLIQCLVQRRLWSWISEWTTHSLGQTGNTHVVTTATELICVQSDLEGPSGGSGPAVWERRPDEMRLKGREIISGTVSKYSVETLLQYLNITCYPCPLPPSSQIRTPH